MKTNQIYLMAFIILLIGVSFYISSNLSGFATAPLTNEMPLYRCLLSDKSFLETLDKNCEGLTEAKNLGVLAYVNKGPVIEKNALKTSPVYRCIRGNAWVYVERKCDIKSEDDIKSKIKNSFLGNIYTRPFQAGTALGSGWGDVKFRPAGTELVYYCADKRGRWYYSFQACLDGDYGLPDRKGHLGGYAYMRTGDISLPANPLPPIPAPCTPKCTSTCGGEQDSCGGLCAVKPTTTTCKTTNNKDGKCDGKGTCTPTIPTSCVGLKLGIVCKINNQEGKCDKKETCCTAGLNNLADSVPPLSELQGKCSTCTTPGEILHPTTGQCTKCTRGQIQYIRDDGYRMCQKCPSNLVSNKEGTKCITCPAGKTQTNWQSEDTCEPQCKGVPKGTECTFGGSYPGTCNEKKECSPKELTCEGNRSGASCKTAGKEGYCDNKQKCLLCPTQGINQYTMQCSTCKPGEAENPNTKTCSLCPGGTIQKPLTLNDGIRVCTKCQDNQVSSKDRTKCISCPTGTKQTPSQTEETCVKQ